MNRASKVSKQQATRKTKSLYKNLAPSLYVRVLSWPGTLEKWSRNDRIKKLLFDMY